MSSLHTSHYPWYLKSQQLSKQISSNGHKLSACMFRHRTKSAGLQSRKMHASRGSHTLKGHWLSRQRDETIVRFSLQTSVNPGSTHTLRSTSHASIDRWGRSGTQQLAMIVIQTFQGWYRYHEFAGFPKSRVRLIRRQAMSGCVKRWRSVRWKRSESKITIRLKR